jgi:DNA replication protein DnaC
MLTQDQEKAKQELLGFLVSDTSKSFVLSGYAGVGKSFLIQHVQEAYNTCIAKTISGY